MKRIFLLLVLLSFIFCGCAKQSHFEETRLLMGTFAKIEIFGTSEKVSRQAMDKAFSEIKRIENLLSRYDPQSQITQINKNTSGKPVAADKEVIDLIARAVELNHNSLGCFDITIAPAVELWGFYQREGKIPSSEEIKQALAKIGSDKIILDEHKDTIYLKDGAELDLGGIGKGYAIDRAIDVLEKNGIKCALVNIGGNLKTLGLPKKGFWVIGVKDPLNKDNIITRIKIYQEAVSTSGSYENYFEADGKKYSHIIDPRTGFPADEILSATVISDSAMYADALSTIVSVMGKESGLELLKESGSRGVIIDKEKGLNYTD